jgi:hypothetical protein
MSWLRDLGTGLADAYQHEIIDPHKQPQMALLVSFLVTFSLVRFITHSIRAGRFTRIFHNVSTGGTHLHHLVPGILLMMVSGYIAIAVDPSAPKEPMAILFGIGMALTLDEFALWLHLEDVYWAKQGRQSVDAVIITATVIGLGILGWGFWAELARVIGDVF